MSVFKSPSRSRSSERECNLSRASKNLGDQHNIKYYEEGMRRNIDKKLAIFDFIPEDVNIFLDIGCATGELLDRKRQYDIYPSLMELRI